MIIVAEYLKVQIIRASLLSWKWRNSGLAEILSKKKAQIKKNTGNLFS